MALSGSFNTSGWYSDSKKDYVSLKFSWTATQNISSNTSTISWTLTGDRTAAGYVKSGGFKVVIDGETVYSKSTDYRIELYKDTLVASGSKILSHADDGSRSFEVYAEGAIYKGSVNSTGSATFTLDTIPRVSTLTASNGTLGTAQTLTINRASSDFYHRIKYTCGTESANITVDDSDRLTGTSIPFTPPLSLASQNTSGTSVSIVLTAYTYAEDGTLIGTSSKTISAAIPANVKPSISISVSDPMGYAETYGGYVQSRSKMLIELSTTLAYGSSIQKKTITADGQTYTYTPPLPASTTTDVITNSGEITVSATVTDGRSRSGNASTTINVLPYAAPRITKLTVHRCNADGTENASGSYAKVTYGYSIASLNALNGKSAQLKYKKSADSEYTTVALTAAYSVADEFYIFAADDGASYDVVISVSDSFTGGSPTTHSTSVSTAGVIMHFNASGKGLGLGKISEKTEGIDVGWNIEMNGNKIAGLGTPTNDTDAVPKIYADGLFDNILSDFGIAAYTGSGDAAIDPDTTTEFLILTNANTPMGDSYFMYIITVFYNEKSATANRAQLAIPYNRIGSVYHRYYSSGAFSDWRRHVNEDENVVTKDNFVYSNGTLTITM